MRTEDRRNGLFWSLPELYSSTFGKTGPGFGWGVGCGVGVGAGLIGGIGVGLPLPGINLGVGVGAGCGLGIGFGYGVGTGTAWDRNAKYTNLGRAAVRRVVDKRRREKPLPPAAEELSTMLGDLYEEVVRAISDGKR